MLDERRIVLELLELYNASLKFIMHGLDREVLPLILFLCVSFIASFLLFPTSRIMFTVELIFPFFF